MKWLLLIPAFMLFLSNVSFTVEMKMTDKSAMTATIEGCSKKSSCHKKMQQEACPAMSSLSVGGEMLCAMKSEESSNSAKCPPGKPCKGTDATCICICSFQFSAPAPILEDFQFTLTEIPSKYTGFLSLKWKDPHITAPWQPPDVV